jgi:Replication-relaxation
MKVDAAAPTTRQKRFYRSADPRPMKLTTRDINLLAHVAKHRMLSSDQLAMLDGGSAQNMRRCLRALFDHGYLDRPGAQLAQATITGPQPMVYGLTRKGARALREHETLIDPTLNWSDKNRRAGSVFIAHTVAVGDFMAKLEVACRTRDDVELLEAKAIIANAPPKTRMAREPLRWLAKVSDRGEFKTASVIPDELFGLAFADGTASYFMLEIDRGTMPVVRKGTNRTSFTRKLQTYYEGWKQKRHEEQLGIRQFRVLTVTTSPVRVQTMVAAVQDLTAGAGSNVFLFAVAGALEGRSPLDLEWISGKGEAVSLLK